MTISPPTPDEEAQAEKVRNMLVDIQTKTFDRAMAYTNLIMFGGYAGAFAVWNFVRYQLTDLSAILIAILITISLATFVFFEVFKMVFTTKVFMAQRKIFLKTLPPIQFFAELKSHQAFADRLTARQLMPIWVVALTICVSTALSAVVLLLWNFVAILSGAPLWP